MRGKAGNGKLTLMSRTEMGGVEMYGHPVSKWNRIDEVAHFKID